MCSGKRTASPSTELSITSNRFSESSKSCRVRTAHQPLIVTANPTLSTKNTPKPGEIRANHRSHRIAKFTATIHKTQYLPRKMQIPQHKRYFKSIFRIFASKSSSTGESCGSCCASRCRASGVGVRSPSSFVDWVLFVSVVLRPGTKPTSTRCPIKDSRVPTISFLFRSKNRDLERGAGYFHASLFIR